MTEVSAVVISHGHAHELETLLPILAPQVDELVVVANRPGSLPAALPAGARVVTTGHPLAIASTTGSPNPSCRDDCTRQAAPR